MAKKKERPETGSTTPPPIPRLQTLYDEEIVPS